MFSNKFPFICYLLHTSLFEFVLFWVYIPVHFTHSLGCKIIFSFKEGHHEKVNSCSRQWVAVWREIFINWNLNSYRIIILPKLIHVIVVYKQKFMFAAFLCLYKLCQFNAIQHILAWIIALNYRLARPLRNIK